MTAFSGKTAIVTGGASGIGAELSRGLCSAGAHVVIADIDTDKSERLSNELGSKGCSSQAVYLDVRDYRQTCDVVNSVCEERGHLDLMFNNAGMAVGGKFQDIDADIWKKIVDVNLMGVVNGTQAAYERMFLQGFGRIVNIASLLGLWSGILQTAYSATKHGVIGMTLGLRAEAKAYGVDVQAVCPGYIETPLFDAGIMAESLDFPTLKERLPIKFMDVETAAEKILKGVEKNKAIIVFPLYTRVLWWSYRISPALNIALSSLVMRLLLKKGWV